MKTAGKPKKKKGETDQEQVNGQDSATISEDDDDDAKEDLPRSALKSGQETATTSQSQDPADNTVSSTVIIPKSRLTKSSHSTTSPQEVTFKQASETDSTEQNSPVPSTSKGDPGLAAISFDNRSIKQMLRIENQQGNSDDDSDTNEPSVIIQRNIKEITVDPVALATLLRELIKARHEVKIDDDRTTIMGMDWMANV